MNGQEAKAAPTWEEYTSWVGKEDLVAAITLLELDPHARVRRDAAQWLRFCESGGQLVDGVWVPDPLLEWSEWVANVDLWGRDWSSTELRLFDVVAGLTTGRPFSILGMRCGLHDWTALTAWRILAAWGTGASAAKIRAAARC